jgi:DNA-binding CsgD family transcriptional regulator
LSPEAARAEAIAVTHSGASVAAQATVGAGGLGLTRREREVLRLLAEGRSDREIAAALFISPKTAGTHVSHLLGKLGVTSRAAAVAHVHRHRLV